jgi:hypothetical protein
MAMTLRFGRRRGSTPPEIRFANGTFFPEKCLCRCGYVPGLYLGRKIFYDHFGRGHPWGSAAS